MLAVLAEVQSALPLAPARNTAERDVDKRDTSMLTSAAPESALPTASAHSPNISASSPQRRALPKQQADRRRQAAALKVVNRSPI